MVHWYVLRVLAQPLHSDSVDKGSNLAAPVCSIYLIAFVQWHLDSDKYKYFYLIALRIKAELLGGRTYTCRHIYVDICIHVQVKCGLCNLRGKMLRIFML